MATGMMLDTPMAQTSVMNIPIVLSYSLAQACCVYIFGFAANGSITSLIGWTRAHASIAKNPA